MLDMTDIRCIAIDDEPLALDQIARYIGRIPKLRLVGAYLSASQAWKLLEEDHVDLLFLDIEMPSCNGMDFARRVIETFGPMSIIFTTAYPQFAVEGFRIDAVDYLLKPLCFEDMQEAVEKVVRRLSQQAIAQNTETNSSLFIRSDGATHKVDINNILYIKGLSEYVQICVKGMNKLLTTHDSIKHFEEMLPADMFFRVHKSFLVNLSHLEGADAESVTIGGTTLPIGQKYRAAFKEYLKSKQP